MHCQDLCYHTGSFQLPGSVFQGDCPTLDGTGLSRAQATSLLQGKPAAAVHYTKNMPDIEALMQQWPAEAEELLHEMRLPDETLVSQHIADCWQSLLRLSAVLGFQNA